MAAKDLLKQISIDRLIPGMFIVDMDVPWYRTPFLSHKRLIKDLATIQTMKQYGIRMVTIDTSKGKDVQTDTAKAVSGAQEGAPSEQVAVETSVGVTPPAQPQAAAPHALYAEAQEAVERIFADLEQGLPPPPAATKAIVSKVLTQILGDRTALMTQLAVQKVKQFDRSLAAHALDTCVLSLVVAVESGLDETMQAHVGAGALLHDAGYVRLPRNLVRRRDECSEQERVLLQQHPKLGIALLAEGAGVHEEVRRIVVEHHERGDGSGFPAGQKSGSISQLAKIVGIVDWYDGMVSRRGGRPAMLPHDAVRQLFLAGERGQFEKALVEMVIRSVGVYPVGSLVRLNTGEQAIVVGVNPEQRLKPLVKITGGPQGESYANPAQVDLAEQAQDRGVRTVLRVLDPVQERVNIAMYLDEASPEAA
jgi:HD-GYP domain-containing protein (c-di-GMP phosphodiesterase class II)